MEKEVYPQQLDGFTLAVNLVCTRGVPTTRPVRYPAEFQENVLPGIRPDFLQCPAGYYLEIIILNIRNI